MLFNQIINNGYVPDAILQIDRESNFAYDEELHSSHAAATGIPPLKILTNNLLRRPHMKGVGTSDRFETIDVETGMIKETPRPGPYQAFFMEKRYYDQAHFLPGGGMLCRPEIYIAGMKAMTENVPSVGLEDYMLSKMTMELDGKNNSPTRKEDVPIAITTLITHLNSITPDKVDTEGHIVTKGYIEQLRRWVSGRRAIDLMFPQNSRMANRESTQRQIMLFRYIIRDRVMHLVGGDLSYARQIIKDIIDIPDIAKALRTTEVEDLFRDDASWRHT